jgi:hypothetical protein
MISSSRLKYKIMVKGSPTKKWSMTKYLPLEDLMVQVSDFSL